MKRRRLARENLIAARLFDGIIATVEHNIDGIPAFGTDQRDLGHTSTNNLRGMLPAVVLNPVMDQLGKLDRETIDNCFRLCAQIDHFRATTSSTTAANLHKELEAIRRIAGLLRDEIAQKSKEAEKILADTLD